MAGEELVETLCRATGLPFETIHPEVQRLIHRRGLDQKELQVEDLRQILAEYLQEVLLQAAANN